MCLGLLFSSLAILITLNSSVEWFLLIASFYFGLYIYYAWITYKADLFIKGNDSYFEYKFGLLKNSKNFIYWEIVRKVKIGPAYIAFFKKSGRKRTVSISWLPYAKVIEIKDKLIQLCNNKKVTYEVVDFVRYNEIENRKKEKKKDKKRL